MHRRQLLFAFLGMASFGGKLFAQAEPKAKATLWEHFKLKDLAEVTVESAVGKTASKEKELLEKVTAALKALPAEGEIFVKISGDVPQTKLTLTSAAGTSHSLVFYGDAMQAPDTKFYAAAQDKAQALRLFDLVSRAKR